MKLLKGYIDKFLEGIGSLILIIMVVTGSWQILSRYIFKSPSTLSEELLRFSLVWLSVLSASYMVGKNKHINLGIAIDRLDKEARYKVDIFIQLIFLTFSTLVMTFGGIKAVSISMEQYSPALGIPMGIIYMVLPIAGVISIFYNAYNLKELLEEKRIVNKNSEKLNSLA